MPSLTDSAMILRLMQEAAEVRPVRCAAGERLVRYVSFPRHPGWRKEYEATILAGGFGDAFLAGHYAGMLDELLRLEGCPRCDVDKAVDAVATGEER